MYQGPSVCFSPAHRWRWRFPPNAPGISPTAAEKLTDTLYSFRWGPYRTMLMVAGKGVIVADSISTEAAQALRGEFSKITNENVKFVVYSHSHWDHAAGARVFKNEGAKIVAQEKCAANMRETPNPDMLPPAAKLRAPTVRMSSR